MAEDTYTIKEMLIEIQKDYVVRFESQDKSLVRIEKKVDDTSDKVGFQNGRVRKLEDWSMESMKVIESNSNTLANYKIDKARLWTAVAVVVFLGGAIITLAIMAIDTKIEKGIEAALSAYEIDISP